MKQTRLLLTFLLLSSLFLGLQACSSSDVTIGASSGVAHETDVPVLREITEGLPTIEISPTIEINLPEPFTPTPQPSVTPNLLPAPTLIPNPSPLPIVTTIPWPALEIIGYSNEGQALETFRFGNGQHWFVAIGAIHGAHECNTNQLLDALIDRFENDPALLPENVTLFVVPLVNPHGCAMNVRPNSRGVDLNRNWHTDDWVPDAEGPSGTIAGLGGANPFSELETKALSLWLLKLRGLPHDGPLNVISFHSLVTPSGLVQPGYREKGIPDPVAQELALAYADASGYQYSSTWVGNYSITGELIHWAAENNIVAIDVELPDANAANTIPVGRSETHVDTNLRSLITVIEEMTSTLP